MAIESVEAFVERASAWVKSNLPSVTETAMESRQLQALLFEGGFAGIAFPKEYGGAGLTLDHHKAFYDVADALQRQVRSKCHTAISTIGPTLLEHASHETKLRFLPSMLNGEHEWVQLLSEPQSGSDLAGAVTRLTPDGDTYILNGSKMWSTGAHKADWAICLCRSNWDVPKHHGLSMIALPLKGTPGLTIHQTRKSTGELGDFCEEFFDDVRIPTEDLIGNENDGWLIARTLMLNERYFHGNVNFGYSGLRDRTATSFYGKVHSPGELVVIAERRQLLEELTPLIADTYIERVVGPLTEARVNTGMRVGTHEGPWGSLLKLQWSVGNHQEVRAQLSVLGSEAVIWDGDDADFESLGRTWIFSRARRIAGGTSEMQRNTISERLLGLPRDPAADLDKPFKDVQTSKRQR